MISAHHRQMLLPLLLMLLALTGMSLSAVGEASSHGLAELAGKISGGDHDHGHDELDERIGAWVQTLEAVDLFH